MSEKETVARISETPHLTLYEMRKESGVSGARATEYADISYRALRNWETGKSVPNILSVIRLLEIYGYTFEQLDTRPFQFASDARDELKQMNEA